MNFLFRSFLAAETDLHQFLLGHQDFVLALSKFQESNQASLPKIYTSLPTMYAYVKPIGLAFVNILDP